MGWLFYFNHSHTSALLTPVVFAVQNKFIIDYNSHHIYFVMWRVCVLSRDCDTAQSLLRFSFALLKTELISLEKKSPKSRRGHLNAHPVLSSGTVYIFGGFKQGLHARLWRTSRQASLFTVWASVLAPRLGGSSSATEASWPRCLASLWSSSCTRGRVTCLTVSITECDSRDERWVCLFYSAFYSFQRKITFLMIY